MLSHDAGLAQSVEQRTENPRVPGSIPGPGTFKIKGLGDSSLAPFSLIVPKLCPSRIETL